MLCCVVLCCVCVYMQCVQVAILSQAGFARGQSSHCILCGHCRGVFFARRSLLRKLLWWMSPKICGLSGSPSVHSVVIGSMPQAFALARDLLKYVLSARPPMDTPVMSQLIDQLDELDELIGEFMSIFVGSSPPGPEVSDAEPAESGQLPPQDTILASSTGQSAVGAGPPLSPCAQRAPDLAFSKATCSAQTLAADVMTVLGGHFQRYKSAPWSVASSTPGAHCSAISVTSWHEAPAPPCTTQYFHMDTGHTPATSAQRSPALSMVWDADQWLPEGVTQHSVAEVVTEAVHAVIETAVSMPEAGASEAGASVEVVSDVDPPAATSCAAAAAAAVAVTVESRIEAVPPPPSGHRPKWIPEPPGPPPKGAEAAAAAAATDSATDTARRDIGEGEPVKDWRDWHDWHDWHAWDDWTAWWTEEEEAAWEATQPPPAQTPPEAPPWAAADTPSPSGDTFQGGAAAVRPGGPLRESDLPRWAGEAGTDDWWDTPAVNPTRVVHAVNFVPLNPSARGMDELTGAAKAKAGSAAAWADIEAPAANAASCATGEGGAQPEARPPMGIWTPNSPADPAVSLPAEVERYGGENPPETPPADWYTADIATQVRSVIAAVRPNWFTQEGVYPRRDLSGNFSPLHQAVHEFTVKTGVVLRMHPINPQHPHHERSLRLKWGTGPRYMPAVGDSPGYKVVVSDLPGNVDSATVAGWLDLCGVDVTSPERSVLSVRVPPPRSNSGAAQAFISCLSLSGAKLVFFVCWHWYFSREVEDRWSYAGTQRYEYWVKVKFLT